MIEFAADGEVYHEKAIGFLRALFRRWKSLGVSHTLSIVLYSRCSAAGRPPEREGWTEARPQWRPVQATGAAAGGELMRDCNGTGYTDYYKLVSDSESRADWESLLPTLKHQFLSFVPSLKRREPTISSLPVVITLS